MTIQTLRESPNEIGEYNTIEEIEKALGKELIQYVGIRRRMTNLTYQKLESQHKELFQKHANLYKGWTSIFFTAFETFVKAGDLVAVTNPHTLPFIPKGVKKMTGIKVMSFARFKDGEGVLDHNKISDAFSKALSAITGVAQSVRHVSQNHTTAEQAETKGYEEQCKSHSDHKRQEYLRILQEEQEVIRKKEQADERTYQAKINMVR